jgi:hypothetical protein
VKQRQIVLVDTNVIIEAVRTRCWQALKGYFDIHTVEKCCEEARTGEAHRPGYVTVKERDLAERLRVHPVTDAHLIALSLQYGNIDRLDHGERHLWAHAYGRTDNWTAICADRAAVNAAFELGWKDRLVSLEETANCSGVRPLIKKHFSSQWLSGCRTEFLLRRSNS